MIWIRSSRWFLFRRSIRRVSYLVVSKHRKAGFSRINTLARKDLSVSVVGGGGSTWSLEPRAEWLSLWGANIPASISRKLHAVKVRSQFASELARRRFTPSNALSLSHKHHPTGSRSVGRLWFCHIPKWANKTQNRVSTTFLPHPT